MTISGKDAQRLGGLNRMQTLSFREEFEQAIQGARAYLKEYLKTHDPARSAVVLDLDETILDNSGFELLRVLNKLPFREAYQKWMLSAECPAIPETLKFVNWARKQGCPIFFVTARKEYLEEATVRNLERIGLPPSSYQGLYLKPEHFQGDGSTGNFKVWAQQDIRDQGYDIALMMGDQPSDIEGALGHGVKLPNYMYRTR